MQPDPTAPSDLRDLGYGEHMVVWSFRAYAFGRWDCPMVVREYKQACGDLAEDARRALLVFAQQLQVQGRRPVTLSRPGLLGLTRDEQLILAIYAAAQRNDADAFDAHMTWLLARPAGPPFLAAARVTALALQAHGYALGRQPQAAPEPIRRVSAA